MTSEGRSHKYIIKSRTIGVHNFTRLNSDNFNIPVMLQKTPGIISAKLDEDKGKLYVVYDLEQTSFDDIEIVLDKIGCPRDNTFWERLRESFIRFAEENERSHLEAHVNSFEYSPMGTIEEKHDTDID